MNPKTKKWTENDFQFITQNKELKNSELATKTNLPISVIKNLKHNFKLLKHPKLTERQKISIFTYYKIGVEIFIIAERMQLPYHKVYFFCKKHCN